MQCIVAFHEGNSVIPVVVESSTGPDEWNGVEGLDLTGPVNVQRIAVIGHLHLNVLSSPMSRYNLLEIYMHDDGISFGVVGRSAGVGPVGLGIFTLSAD